jgi:replicative DNA helicase Mcm
VQEAISIAQRFETFFEQFHDELQRRALGYPQERSIDIDWEKLSRFDPSLADELLLQPDAYLKEAEKAIEELRIVAPNELVYKPHVRLHNIPSICDAMVERLGAEHLDKMVKVEGAVSWIAEIKPLLKRAAWQCVYCEEKIFSSVDRFAVKAPVIHCKCGRDEWALYEPDSEFINVQRAQMQELVEKLRGSAPTAHVQLWMEDDLANLITPGEKVQITGILRLRPIKEGRGKQAIYDKVLDVLHVKKLEQEFEALEISREEEEKILNLSKNPRLFETLVKSIAPSIYGYDEMKAAIALQLFGGTPDKRLPDGQMIRNDTHVLLVGDPGCLIGDERVVMANGAIERLEDLGSHHLQEINKQMLTGQGYARDLATVFHSYKQQPILEVLTESGKCIKGTLNHPLLTVNGTLRNWKRLDELKIGDKLATVPWIPCSITTPVATGWKPLAYKAGPHSFTQLPEHLNPSLAGLLGYVVGDGWVTRTLVAMDVNSEEQDLIAPLVKMISEEFGIEPKVRTEKRANKKPMTIVALHNTDVAHNLQFLRERRVPKLVMRSGNKVAAEFLAWLFEADGCVFSKGRGKRAVQLKSSNIELLRDVQVLLLRFSIHSRIVERNLCIRRAESMFKFAKHVGFRSLKKKTRLEQLVSDCEKLPRMFKQQRYEKIVSIKQAGVADVFDVEVPKSHRFIANGIISHNTAKSSLLQYVSRIAPKCIVVSGKGASGVGLTASAERDEQLGGWILKAGAMVLANGGQVNIDELDKMDPDDRSALHEAMEQQTISIAKAGIVTKFPSKTAVLAAANPKMGRFDPNTPPAAQFDIPPTLLSRFDLIFTIKDQLDETHDKKMADHILMGHKIAAEKGIAPEGSAILPLIEADMLRKYVAYARRNIFPILTDEAVEKIREFYLEMRKLGKQSNTFPVTARQIEGLIRIAEASAKMRLSQKVESVDADRSIGLVTFVLNDIFIDKETGRIDSDIINVGQPKSRMDKVRSVMNLVQELEKKTDLVSIDDVVREASSFGIEEKYVRELIEQLKRQGDLYEPKHGHIKTSRGKGW